MAKKPNERMQIGAKLDADLYRRMRAESMLERRTVAELLDDAMEAYLASKRRKKVIRRTK